jgi:hypothetical protein
MKRQASLGILAAALVALYGTGVDVVADERRPIPRVPEAFLQYWYPHGAEISRFSLRQSRYGELHEGEAVQIFVTETLNPELQVKADRPGPGDIPVLKLNNTRRFYTGIYPYSVMTSVFAPVDPTRHFLPPKITFTGQEWCGHVFVQFNLRDSRYQVQSRSYFESEADRDFHVKAVLSEDAVWTLIRIAPERLPTGSFPLIPGVLYSRLLHRPIRVHHVSADLQPAGSRSMEGLPLTAYTLRYPDLDRTLTIRFETDFPHRIQGWEDRYPALPSHGGRMLTTRARRTHTLMIDYWNRNGSDDRKWLEKLGIEANP